VAEQRLHGGVEELVEAELVGQGVDTE